MTITVTITADDAQEVQRTLLALAFPGHPSQPKLQPPVAEGAISPAPATGNGPTTSWEAAKPTSWDVMKPAEAVELIEVADLPVPEEAAEPPLQSSKRKPPPKSKYKAKAAPPKAKPEPEPEPELEPESEPDGEPEPDNDDEDDLDMTKVRAMIVRYHQAFDEASTAALLKLHGGGCSRLSDLSPKLFRKVYNAARLALPAD